MDQRADDRGSGRASGPEDSPVPPVSEPRAPDAGRMQVPPGNPLLLSLTLQELLARDAVQVELVPEKKGLFLKHVEYEVSSQGKQEENDVVEKLNLFLDLLQSYKDLCERHEKGVLHRHQRALHKYSLMKRQMMSAAAQSREPESVEQLESRIVEESVIQTMELRNYYSLYCLHQETQLVHAYLPLTSHILGAFVNSQVQGHKEMSKVWNDLQPKLRCLFVGPHSAPAPPRPPQDGPSAH